MRPDDPATAGNLYGDRWAEVYDEEYAAMVPPEAQLALLATLAGGGAALELGIGTGRVALPLADRGVQVVGLEISEPMVERLRSKPGGDAIPVTIGDMATVPVDGPFRLVYVLLNSLFALLTQDEQVACFVNVARVLEPGGSFCIGCFVPDPSSYHKGQALRVVNLGLDDVRIDVSLHDAANQRVASQTIRLGNGAISVRPSGLRYAWPSELDLMARVAGLRLGNRWADWHQRPFTSTSGNHVSVYQKPLEDLGG